MSIFFRRGGYGHDYVMVDMANLNVKDPTLPQHCPARRSPTMTARLPPGLFLGNFVNGWIDQLEQFGFCAVARPRKLVLR